LRILIKPDIAGPISREDGLCGVKFALPVVLSGLARPWSLQGLRHKGRAVIFTAKMLRERRVGT
jgi:hypothetical protein